MLWTVIGVVVASVIGLSVYRYHRNNSREGGEYSNAIVEARMREAYDAKLKIGTKKDAVVRFFTENGIKVTFSQNEASGIINATGCSPLGCGTDRALIRLRMNVDENGSVTSKPEVDGMYADCV